MLDNPFHRQAIMELVQAQLRSIFKAEYNIESDKPIKEIRNKIIKLYPNDKEKVDKIIKQVTQDCIKIYYADLH